MAVVLPPINEVIDLHSVHLAGARRHPPIPVMAVLLGTAAISLAIIGFGNGRIGRRFSAGGLMAMARRRCEDDALERWRDRLARLAATRGRLSPALRPRDALRPREAGLPLVPALRSFLRPRARCPVVVMGTRPYRTDGLARGHHDLIAPAPAAPRIAKAGGGTQPVSRNSVRSGTGTGYRQLFFARSHLCRWITPSAYSLVM
jgi:hypothetical protein